MRRRYLQNFWLNYCWYSSISNQTGYLLLFHLSLVICLISLCFCFARRKVMFCLLYFHYVAERCVFPAPVVNRNLVGLFCRYAPLMLRSQRLLKMFGDYIYTLCKVGHSLNLCNLLFMVYTYLMLFVRRLNDYLFIKPHTYDIFYNHSFMINIYNPNKLIYNFYLPYNNDIYLNSFKLILEMANKQLYYLQLLLFTISAILLYYNIYYILLTLHIYSHFCAIFVIIFINYVSQLFTILTYIFYWVRNLTFNGFTAFSFSNLKTSIHYNCTILLLCMFCRNNDA